MLKTSTKIKICQKVENAGVWLTFGSFYGSAALALGGFVLALSQNPAPMPIPPGLPEAIRSTFTPPWLPEAIRITFAASAASMVLSLSSAVVFNAVSAKLSNLKELLRKEEGPARAKAYETVIRNVRLS
jgi:hypothetical protein